MTQPEDPQRLQRSTVRWVVVLFAGSVVLQRFSVPVLELALLLPALLIWCAYGLTHRIVVVDRGRAGLWLAAFGVTALSIPVRGALVPGATGNLMSWGLFMAVWAPFVLRLTDNRSVTYLRVLRGVSTVGFWLAAACIAMMATQLAGIRYVDWIAMIVPVELRLTGFVITYPVAYGEELYRANAWIGLEPSMVSAQLGLATLAAIYVRASPWRILVLLVGMVTTVSGSGFALLGVGLLVIAAHPVRTVLIRYTPILLVVLVTASVTEFGTVLLERVTEFQSSNSSTSLRAIEPYRHLWPDWVEDSRYVLLGQGPGSAQDLVDSTGIRGLLVPSPAKVFFEYGLLPGAVLAAFLLACYVQGPSRGFAVSLLLSLWLLQPGTTTVLLVAPLLIFVTLWAPRPGPVVESDVGLLRAQRRPKQHGWEEPRPGAAGGTARDAGTTTGVAR